MAPRPCLQGATLHLQRKYYRGWMITEKLQKILANFGLGSRREIERWIADGRVSVDGKIAKLGDRAVSDAKIRVDGQLLHLDKRQRTQERYLVYNKDEGEMCTRSDPQGRPTVFDHLPSLRNGRWVMVGRLDINTSGLLIFTTDGELAYRLMHPKYEIEREYAVRVFGEVTPTILKNLCRGVELEDGLAKFTSIQEMGGEGSNHWYNVTLSEGRNREVRRLWESQDLKVSRLMRIRYGNLILPRELKRGQFMDIPPADLNALQNLVEIFGESDEDE